MSLVPLLLILLLTVLSLPTPVPAGNVEGRLAYRKGEYALALREFDSSDNGGPVDAYFLALMHLRGEGVARDESLGLNLLTKSADGGYYAAQYLLGQRYLYGLGVPKNRKLAVSYLTTAASDDYRAVILLKIIGVGSRGEKKDREKVVADIKRLARAKVPSAQYTLAFMHLVGDGVPKDGAEEVRWYRAAAAKNSRAAFMLSLMYQFGEGVPHNPEKSFHLMLRAAELGDPRAQYYVGTFFHQGVGTRIDHAAAASWFRQSAESGFADAQLAYGMLLLSGDGVVLDKAQAVEWLGKSAKQGNGRAREVLGELLTYRGQPSAFRMTDASSPYSQDKRQGESQLRLEGKGVILDQGTFGLKFSLPTLYDVYAPQNQMKSQPLWEKLQGGTFDIIIRQPQ